MPTNSPASKRSRPARGTSCVATPTSPSAATTSGLREGPFIICADADIEVAAGGATAGALINGEQDWTAATRADVHRAVYDRFLARTTLRRQAVLTIVRRGIIHSPTANRSEDPIRTVPPIYELTRIEPVHLERLDRQGVFTTGILLEVSETPTRRQTLADQVDASTNDVLTWRDEALMLNLAGFGATEHLMLRQAGFEGLRAILEADLEAFRASVDRAATELNLDPPSELALQGWWEQARSLEDE